MHRSGRMRPLRIVGVYLKRSLRLRYRLVTIVLRLGHGRRRGLREGTLTAPRTGDNTDWQKSSFSDTGNCIEVRRSNDRVEVRHSKDPGQPNLMFTVAEFAAFAHGIKAGEFDHLFGPDGSGA